MYCNICAKSFTGLVCYQQHEASEKHKNKVKHFQMLAANDVSQTPASSFSSIDSQIIRCDTCVVSFIGLSDFQKHVNSLQHVDMVKKKNESSATEDHLNCIVSKPGSACAKETNPGSFMPFNSPNMMSISYAECVACSKKFSGPEPYQQHLASEAHKKKLLRYQLFGNKLNLDTVDSDKIVPFVKPDDNASKNGATGTIEPYADCFICNMQFSGPEPYQLHVDSESHQKKIAMNLNSSIQNSGNHNNGLSPLRCQVCDKDFSGPIPYNDHMISFAHKKRVQNIEFLKNIRSPTTLQADSTTQVPDNFMHNMTSAMGNRSWYCEVCKKQSSGPIPHEAHLASEGHHKNIRAMEMEHNLKMKRESLMQDHLEIELNTVKLNELSRDDQMSSPTNNFESNEVSKDFYISKDLILCDALKNIGVIPEKDLNVTTFYPNDELVFV